MHTSLHASRHIRKEFFSYVIMMLVISTFFLVMLPFSTVSGEAYNMQAPGPGSIPIIDGIWSLGEWDDALEYTATNSTLKSYVRVKWNDAFLYLLIDSPWDTTNSSLFPYENTWIAFDTMHSQGSAPQTDDYLFSTSTMIAYTGDGTKWTPMVVPSGLQAQSSSSDEWGPGVQPSPKNSTPHRIDEFKVPLTHVGSLGTPVGFYVIVVDDVSDPDGVGLNDPPTAWVEWPPEAGGDPRGWPADPYIDPCPTPDFWGDLTLLQRPMASYSYSPDIPDVNETVSFDASVSQDLDGSIVSYAWDFGDGNVTTVDTATITHSFSAGRSYEVNLTVVDNDALSGSVLHTVTVGVKAAFTFSPAAPNPSDIVAFNATESYSRGGTIINYVWTWDDTSSNVTSNPITAHTFSVGGSYDVSLTVIDDTGSNASVAHTIAVGAPRANFTFWPSAPNLGDPVVFDGSSSYDLDGSIASYTWKWGDSSSNVTIDKVTTHTFSTTGNYSVTLTVTDNLELNGSFDLNFMVYASREAYFQFSPSTPNEGDTVTFNASLSNDPGGAISNYTWNFGDGNTTTVDAPTDTVTHLFSASGSYIVNLTITDSDYLESWHAHTVDVGIPPSQVVAPFSQVVPSIDGIWDSGEWTDANEYVISGAGGESYMRFKWGPGNVTGDFLYILIDSPWDMTNATGVAYENAFVAFDTLHDKSMAGPQRDDYLFNDGYSRWSHAWNGNGTIWTILWQTEINYTETGYLSERWSGSSPKSATMHRTEEFRVPLDFVGTTNQNSGFYIIIIDGASDPDGWGQNLPPTAWVEWPPEAGGDPRGWPEPPYIDPCPTLDRWGYLTLELPTSDTSSITLDISPLSITLSGSVTITGTVSNTTSAIAGVDVTIQHRFVGKTEWNNITIVKTDSMGRYSYDWAPAESGSPEIKASWNGDANTYGAESGVETLEVKSEPFPILVIAAAVAAIAVVIAIAIYLLKVRKPK